MVSRGRGCSPQDAARLAGMLCQTTTKAKAGAPAPATLQSIRFILRLIMFLPIFHHLFYFFLTILIIIFIHGHHSHNAHATRTG